jgi:hypothetical protein
LGSLIRFNAHTLGFGDPKEDKRRVFLYRADACVGEKEIVR